MADSARGSGGRCALGAPERARLRESASRRAKPALVPERGRREGSGQGQGQARVQPRVQPREPSPRARSRRSRAPGDSQDAGREYHD